MTGLAVKISERRLRLSTVGIGTQNAWAAYVRRRWPHKCQANVEAEWDLSPGRANGVVFANITQRTIDAILDHPRGGPAVAMRVLAIRFGCSVDQLLSTFIQSERERLRQEREANDRDDAGMAAMAADLAAVLGVGSRRSLGLVSAPARKAGHRARQGDRRDNRGAE